MVLLLIALAVVTILVIKFTFKFLFHKDKIDTTGYKEGWFGRGPKPEEKESDESIKPFKINIPEEVLEDLKQRLQRTRLEEPVEDSKFLYGFNPNYMKTVIEYWKNEYDWRKCEKELNKYPHYKTRIEGIDIHFVHIKPVIPENRNIKVLPLMLLHGWPGSFVEFYKIIPLLTTVKPDSDFVFEVICPSLPGYGFSESAHQKGCNARAVTRMYITLMERLGIPKFYVQGGDWGSYISSLMARYYAPRVKGLHMNMYFFSPKSWDLVKFFLVTLFPSVLNPDEYKTLYPLRRKFRSLMEESGYFHIQATKPDTLGCGMSDSPSGMAAYLLEKFSVATNHTFPKLEDGGLTKKFTMEELITNVMVYWVNNNFTAAARFYKENVRDILKQTHEGVPVTVPSAVAVFPNEVLMYPRMMMSQQMRDLVSYNIMPRGGHFAALEEPGLLAEDIWQFAEIVEKKYH